MALSFDDLLSKSCGQVRPISLIAALKNDQKTTKFVINKPYAIIGRHASCDVSLPHLEVSKQHVYLQVLDGRLFCVDQASRTGIIWKDKARLYGWLDAGEWIKVGPYRITLQESVGSSKARANGARSTAPFLMKYKTLPRTAAQLVINDNHTLPLQSQLTVIGRSKYCNLELEEESVSRVHASIVKTIDGKYWLVELMSRSGVKINGKRCHSALLNHNDIIKIGSYSIHFQDITEPVVSPPPPRSKPSVLITPVVVAEPLEPTLQEIPVLAQLAIASNQGSESTHEPITIALSKDDITLSEALPLEEHSSANLAVEADDTAEIELPEMPASAEPVLAVNTPKEGMPLEELEELATSVLIDETDQTVELSVEELLSESLTMDVMQPDDATFFEEPLPVLPAIVASEPVETELPVPDDLTLDSTPPAEVKLTEVTVPVVPEAAAAEPVETELPVPDNLALDSTPVAEVNHTVASVPVVPEAAAAEPVEAEQSLPADLATDSTTPPAIILAKESAVEPVMDVVEKWELEQPAPVQQVVDLSQPSEITPQEEPAIAAASSNQTEMELPVPIVPAVIASQPSVPAPPPSNDIVRAGQHLVLKPAPKDARDLVVKKLPENLPALAARAKPAPAKTPSQMVVRQPSTLVKPKASVFIPAHIKLAPPAAKHQELVSQSCSSDEFSLMDGMMQYMKQMQQEMMTQMRMNMEMMAQFMGNLQKQQTDMIREELAQLGNLNRELLELRQSLLTAAPSEKEAAEPVNLPGNARTNADSPQGTPEKVSPTRKKTGRPIPSTVRVEPTPLSTHAWISQRISCLEKERLTRWEKMKTAVMGK